MNVVINFVTLLAVVDLIISAFALWGSGPAGLRPGAVILALVSVCWLIARFL